MTASPNVVFFLPDQLRADFLSCYGAQFVQTPNIDSIAVGGTRYRNAISSSPLCIPARTALLTGMSPLRNGVIDNTHGLRPDYPALGIQTWPQILAERGYHTAALGKMHFHPWDASHGFAERVIAEDKRHTEIHDDYDDYLQSLGRRKLRGTEQAGYLENKGAIVSSLPWEQSPDHFVADAAVRFIESYDADRPFALMVGLPSPHCPYDPDPRFITQVDAERIPDPVPEVAGNAPGVRQANIEGMRDSWNGVDYADFPDGAKHRIRLHYAALVRQVDEAVGMVLRALEKRFADNTVVALASDHGDYLGDHGLIGKNAFFDAAIRVPLVVRAPSGPAGVVRDELVDLHDLTATILSLTGSRIPDWMDAIPLPGLPGGGARRDHIVGVLGGGWMAFDGRWKLHQYRTADQLLFDTVADPHEQHNRIADPAALPELIRLSGLLTRTVLDHVDRSYDDRMLGADLIWDQAFTRPGWRRPYPHQIRAFEHPQTA